MTSPIFINSEQQGIIEEIKALDARFGADRTLFHSLNAIEAAKALIDKAIAVKLDSRFYHPLQIWISLHDAEARLPEHLRSWQPKA
ncbi:hypothetical protein MRBLMC3_000118 [Sphingobium sp. LMC3-1-1.1]|uniref:hypothetical protein n=1 Tax=Sphingobium sp. LMC3-1-1.1 TaxID=3135241 RepID=UPI00341DF57C